MKDGRTGLWTLTVTLEHRQRNEGDSTESPENAVNASGNAMATQAMQND